MRRRRKPNLSIGISPDGPPDCESALELGNFNQPDGGFNQIGDQRLGTEGGTGVDFPTLRRRAGGIGFTLRPPPPSGNSGGARRRQSDGCDQEIATGGWEHGGIYRSELRSGKLRSVRIYFGRVIDRHKFDPGRRSKESRRGSDPMDRIISHIGF